MPDLFGENAAQQGVAWLSTRWQRDNVRDAVGYASPALRWQIDEILRAETYDARTVRRVVIALASYLLRWQERPTPFGLFAGVAMARIGTAPKVRWGRVHPVAVRADAAWLGDVLARLQQYVPLLERMSVVVNDAAGPRGDRLVAPGPAPDGIGQDLAPIEVSVRVSRAVRAAVEAAQTPVRFVVLRDLLVARFPTTTAQRIDKLLVGLLDQGFLISSLRAPMTCLDALDHVCAVLKAADAEAVPGIAETVRELAWIHQQLAVNDRAAVTGDTVTRRMRALSPVGDVPVIADTVLDCDVEIPEQVVHEARDAVGVLCRLSPFPLGHPAWRDYHSRFRARYGTGALVPVSDLVADSGLGLPADYTGSSRGRAVRQVSERDEMLMAMIQRATLNGSGEIVLTDKVIEALAPADPADLHLPTRVEVAVEIRAASMESLACGRFTLAVTGTPRPGSSMIGRHTHLLPLEGRDAVATSFAAAESGTIAAQLSFTPRKRRNENIARTDQLLPHVIPVAENREPSPQLITLADLAVTADDRRFHLVQISTGRRVEPRVAHALEASVQTPPLARFLADITTARSTVYQAFQFGAAARLPYLPRVRYRRTILSPARWLLTARDLPGRGADLAEWEAGLDTWRRQWRVPDRVAMVEHDRRQPIDLGQQLHRLLLRNRLGRGDQLELREAADPGDNAWLGRTHEVLIPMVLDSRSVPTGRPSFTGPHKVLEVDAGHLPGRAALLCAQLHGHPGRFDEVLIEHLPRLVDDLGEIAPSWWFRRHRQMRQPDADQYLALYLRLPLASVYGAAAERLADWVNALRSARLLSHHVLTTDHPQTGRYGHGAAMDRAYDVFAADSAAALAQIAMTVRTRIPAQAVAAASFIDLAVNFTGSAQAGSEWLIRELPQDQGRLEPTLRERSLDLGDPVGLWSTLRSLPGGEDVVVGWRKRAVALGAYREVLAEQREPLQVLPSLLHLHHLRAVAVDPVLERVTARLARACALRYVSLRKVSQ